MPETTVAGSSPQQKYQFDLVEGTSWISFVEKTKQNGQGQTFRHIRDKTYIIILFISKPFFYSSYFWFWASFCLLSRSRRSKKIMTEKKWNKMTSLKKIVLNYILWLILASLLTSRPGILNYFSLFFFAPLHFFLHKK